MADRLPQGEAPEIGGDGANADPEALTQLALELFNGYLRTERRQELDQAIVLLRAAVAHAAEDDPALAHFLSNLGYVLGKHFEQAPDTSTLAEAVHYLGRAMAAATPGHPDTSSVANQLGLWQLLLFDRTEDVEVLHESVRTLRVAVASAPAGSPERVRAQNNLAQALYWLSERDMRVGETAWALEAVQLARQVVEATPVGGLDHVMYLSNLGEALRVLALCAQQVDIMAEAVRVGWEAVAALPSRTHPGSYLVLERLMRAQEGLFQHTEELALLLDAVRTGRQVVAIIGEAAPGRARYLCNVGVMLYDAYQQTREVELLREAADVAHEAVKLCPEGSPEYAFCQSNYAGICNALYSKSGEWSLLETAVGAAHAALNAVPPDHPEHARYLTNAGETIRLLGDRVSDGSLAQSVLEESVQYCRQAVAATSVDSTRRIARVATLASSIRSLLRFSADPALRAEARACFREMAESESCPTIERIIAYRNIAQLATGPDEAQDRLCALEAAIGLIDLLATNRLSRQDRELRVSRLAGLPGEAAEAALDAGRPARAVELLEQSRGILVAEILGSRGDEYRRLQQRAPGLAARLDTVRARLDVADPADAPMKASARFGEANPGVDIGRIIDRRSAYAEWQELLAEIRALPGFEGFLRVLNIRDLTRSARGEPDTDEPIVILTYGSHRCDALILTGTPEEPVRVVPLPGLTADDLHDNVNRFAAACRAGTDAGRDLSSRRIGQSAEHVLPVLAWLWDTVAEPVLQALGHIRARGDDEDWPRIWWCPVGAFAVLPLHAAGRHVGDGKAAVLDRVISSYTTTVRSLINSRQGNHDADAALGRAVVVAVPSTPGAPLDGAKTESEAISTLIQDARVLIDATRDAVLDALPSYRIAHFACHGRADWADPRRSHLVLADHDVRPLTAADISAMGLRGSLAYLSACDTATSAQRLVDESIHLASAFHLAGYQHVIGTLWPIDDTVAAQFAADFYAQITDGASPVRTDRSAQALHRAVRNLRRDCADNPLLWAAYTHIGP